MNIRRTQLTKPTSSHTSCSNKLSFSEADGESNGKLVRAGLLVGGSALAGAAILNPDKVGMALDSFGSAIEPAMAAIAPIAAGMAEGGMVGAIAGVGYGMVATAGRHDSAPAFAAIGGLMGGALVGGLVGGISGAAGVSPLIAAPVVIGGAAVLQYMS